MLASNIRALFLVCEREHKLLPYAFFLEGECTFSEDNFLPKLYVGEVVALAFYLMNKQEIKYCSAFSMSSGSPSLRTEFCIGKSREK